MLSGLGPMNETAIRVTPTPTNAFKPAGWWSCRLGAKMWVCRIGRTNLRVLLVREHSMIKPKVLFAATRLTKSKNQ